MKPIALLMLALFGGPEARPSAREAAARLGLEGPPVRLEHFRVGEGSGAATATLRRVRSSREAWQLHRTVEVPVAEVAWHLVESFGPEGARSIHREVRQGAARAVRIDWGEQGAIVHCHGEGESRRFADPDIERALGRLALLELARFAPDRAAGVWRVPEPSTGRFEALSCRSFSVRVPGALGPAWRGVELRDEDGRSRALALWWGVELMAFREGAGGPLFRRIPDPATQVASFR